MVSARVGNLRAAREMQKGCGARCAGPLEPEEHVAGMLAWGLRSSDPLNSPGLHDGKSNVAVPKSASARSIRVLIGGSDSIPSETHVLESNAIVQRGKASGQAQVDDSLIEARWLAA